jgi:predicted ATPase
MTKQQVYSVEAQAREHVEAYYSGSKWIERVKISNFKAIRELEVAFPKPTTSEREAWLMLLGENGMGKSSILQAIALTLMGEEHAAELGLDASTFVRRGARIGRVSVKLASVPEPVRIEFRRGRRDVMYQTTGPKALLQAYGATRLLRRGTIAPTRSVQAQNLFDPTAPLADVVGWLGDREQLPDDRFDAVALALKDLLMLDDEDRFDREEDGRVEATVYGETVPLDQLSDGFQSVISLCGNIMMGLFERWEAVEDAEAIVLIDELEAHLHPTWKIEIVNRLRRTFPRVAFIASTHDPLALKGLEQGEIAVLRRDERRRIAIDTNVPSVNDLRADQILTSFLFGLHSTRGDAATQSISRYAELMSKTRRTPEEEQELGDLRGRLQGTMTVHETPAQRAVEHALSQMLLESNLPIVVDTGAKGPPTAEELELRRQVAELLAPAESS